MVAECEVWVFFWNEETQPHQADSSPRNPSSPRRHRAPSGRRRSRSLGADRLVCRGLSRGVFRPTTQRLRSRGVPIAAVLKVTPVSTPCDNATTSRTPEPLSLPLCVPRRLSSCHPAVECPAVGVRASLTRTPAGRRAAGFRRALLAVDERRHVPAVLRGEEAAGAEGHVRVHEGR